MVTYTSTLPDDLLEKLRKIAGELNLPKNKIIEQALELYLTEIDKAAFAASFKKAQKDQELLRIAEEGIHDYYKQLEHWDETS